jgi:mono/diheme cytochrome c family protein
MKSNKRIWVWLGASAALVAVVATATVSLGVYNVAADDPHSRAVYALLETARERSIAVRAAKLQVPANLNDPERIRQGAGNYNAMCVACHLSPEAAATELSKGLYPAPPNLSKQPIAPAEAFWVIKHGIKASGMPAWGGSMDDEFIWNMAAFLQELPKLDKAGYQALVASSDGHSHGGGETDGHSHGDEAGEDHHGGDEGAAMGEDHSQGHESSGMDMSQSKESTTHVHADGKTHEHAAAPVKQSTQTRSDGDHSEHDSMPAKPAEAAPKADDGHDHQH